MECHVFGVDFEDLAFVLKSHKLAEVVGTLFPGDAVCYENEMGVVALLLDDACNVPENVGLFAPGCTVGFDFD